MSFCAVQVLFLNGCATTSNPLSYPKTNTSNDTSTYFGEPVADPFRWLENDKSSEVASWVATQNATTFAYLEKIPFRNALKKRLESMWNYEKFGIPFEEGEYLYFFKNDGLQNHAVLYRKNQVGNVEVFLDPNTFSKDGSVSLAELGFSDDGSLIAYSISDGGSDWRTVITMNTTTKEVIGEPLANVKFTNLAWYKNEGFYYSSYDKPKGSQLSAKTDQHKLYFHKLNTPQSQDKVVFGDTLKRRYVNGTVSEDNRFLIVAAQESTYGNELYVKDLSDPRSQMVKVVGNFTNEHIFIDNEGQKLFFQTDLNAPNGRVVVIDAKSPSPRNWKDLIPESQNVLTASSGGKYIFAKYLKDALSLVKQYDLSGKWIRDIQLPDLGTASGFSGKEKEQTLYFAFSNYKTPQSIYALDAKTGATAVYARPKVDFDSDRYESKQVFYRSKDGTKIPMMITYKKGLALNGKNPTMLYGYGGFSVSMTPSFSISSAVWMENGGIFALPNIRGGAEYGEKWHVAGTKLHKQNVFDDFIAAAEYLIANHYTSSNYLALSGGSNGGLLVGAVMTQRPDLMKVALPAVGVMDMLRYHTFTSGAGWAYDYGTAEDSKEMFEYLKGYSPVHNVKAGVAYPATLITTGDHDDRVVPAHSFKFAAELQQKQSGDNPVLIRIDVKAGHGAGKSVSAQIAESTDRMAFTLFNMGITSLPSN